MATKEQTTQAQEDVLKQLEDVVEGNDDGQEESALGFHDWSTETVNVNTLLKRYKEGKFVLPLCQRLYVWNKEQRASLFESIKHNLPCGTIILAEIDGVKYLVDGLQRTTSLLLLTNDKNLSEEDKKLVRNYKISIVTVLDMDLQSMKHYFAVLNSGVVLAATVKERSKLPESLNNAVLSVANAADGFFRNVETNATFSKTHHHELIAMNALLAVSELKANENKARKLCTLLRENKEVVLENVDKAKTVIERIAKIYDGIDTEIAKRSLNANYVGILIYVMIDNPEFTDLQIRVMTNYIFAGKRSVEEYSETTRQGGSDAKQCADRYDLLVNLLNNPDQMGFNEGGFKEFVKKYKDIDLQDSTGKHAVSFKMLTENDAKDLYLTSINCKQDEWDKIIINENEGTNK